MSLQVVNSQINQLIPPRTYSEVRAEYDALRHAAAVLDLSLTAKLEVNGKNAVQFINGLVTNDIKALQPGEGALAAFLNMQGKVVSICRFYQTGHSLRLEFDLAYHETIYKNLSRFVLAGEFFVQDQTNTTALLSVQGPNAAAVLSALTGQTIEATPEYRNSQVELDGTSIFIVVHARVGTSGFDLFVPMEAKAGLWQRLLDSGAMAAGSDALEIARLEAAIPREGVDVTENNILLEAGYEQAVSYTKGCYLGQEIIARIHWRGQPARQLRGLWIEAAEPPAKGTELWAADGKKVGEITSSGHSLALNRIIALGYVHRYYLTVGTSFTLQREGIAQGTATLAETPFVQ